ncbi:MAG TPA: hypothetical protein VG755_43700 [Nannocystaceae bacterium]|nr:hypothetical protein [Nannocystaceae bacterium]
MANAACVPNIGPQGVRRRMRFGIVVLAICVVAAVAMIGLGVTRAWRLALFLPLAIGAIGIFQARAQT